MLVPSLPIVSNLAGEPQTPAPITITITKTTTTHNDLDFSAAKVCSRDTSTAPVQYYRRWQWRSCQVVLGLVDRYFCRLSTRYVRYEPHQQDNKNNNFCLVGGLFSLSKERVLHRPTTAQTTTIPTPVYCTTSLDLLRNIHFAASKRWWRSCQTIVR